jgi:hypothetical protein
VFIKLLIVFYEIRKSSFNVFRLTLVGLDFLSKAKKETKNKREEVCYVTTQIYLSGPV